MKSTANVDGVITPAEEAKISILDRGFLYGDSVYEVFRTYDGVPYLYREHMDRMDNSARLAQMHMHQSREFLTEEIKRTAKASGIKPGEDIYVRITVTRGGGPIDLNPNRASKTSYVILVKEVPAWNQNFFEDGVKLAIPSIRRNSVHCLEPNIKGGNYLNNVLAVGEAIQLGADDALLCNLDGQITEASNSNILFVMDGIVITPDVSSGNLNGTTKNTILRICGENNIHFDHRPIKIDEITDAAECFVASATREVMPVRTLRLPSGKILEYPKGGGETTRRLARLYKDFVREYVKQFRHEALF